MYDKETNIYICSRCGNEGLPSIYPMDRDIAENPELWDGVKDICTACANYLRMNKARGAFDARSVAT